MAVEDYRSTLVWKDATNLAQQAYNLADDLPQEEQYIMGTQLRELALQVPAGVAADLVSGNQPDRHAVTKLDALLSLINQIYPAIDTANVEDSIRRIVARMRNQTDFNQSQ